MRAALVVVVLLVAAAAVVASYFFLPALEGVTSEKLGHSLAREIDAARPADCSERRFTWSCGLVGGRERARATYRVRMDGRCWTARRVSVRGGEHAPFTRTVTGCLRLRDELRLSDRL